MKHRIKAAIPLLLACILLWAMPPRACLSEAEPWVDYAAAVQLDMDSDTAKATVRVKTFIDGDTTHFYVPSDLVEEGVLSGRYLAVNTPESTGRIEPYGKRAAAYTRERLSAAVSIIIESDDSVWNRDSNGTRHLIWVWYKTAETADYRNLNIELLQEGLAKANSSGQNRYGDVCMAAIAQAKARQLNLYSGLPDPDFHYGEAIEASLRELRLHARQYDGLKVAFTGIVTMNSNNSVYVEELDAESGLYFALPVYYGYNLSGGGMEVLHVGNEVRIVGTMQFYEAGGVYQVSGVTYRMMKPDDPGNIRKLSEGHSPACVPTSLSALLSGKVTLSGDEGLQEYDCAPLALHTSVALEGLTVTECAELDSGWLLTCAAEGMQIGVHASALPEGAQSLTGKAVTVRGIVDLFNGAYQIKAFSPNGIAIEFD